MENCRSKLEHTAVGAHPNPSSDACSLKSKILNQNESLVTFSAQVKKKKKSFRLCERKIIQGGKPLFHDVSSPKGVSAYSSKLLSFQTQGFKRKEGKRKVFLFLLSLPSTNAITTCKTNLLGGQKCLVHSTSEVILIKGKEGPATAVATIHIYRPLVGTASLTQVLPTQLHTHSSELP